MICLASTAAAAFLGARGIRSIVEIELALDDTEMVHLSHTIPVAADDNPYENARHTTRADAILWRNPFDSETGSVGCGGVVNSDPDPETVRRARLERGARIANGIHRRGPSAFEITREAFESMLSWVGEALDVDRTKVKDCSTGPGLGVFGIGKGTVLGRLGFEDGDRVQQVDGLDLCVPEQALEAFARMRKVDHHTVVANRRGKRITLDFSVK